MNTHFFFRVVEQADGLWSCRRGREDFCSCDQLDDAIAHTTDFAREHLPSEVVVHHLDGSVHRVATLD